jgi:hypothetical protein
LAHYGHRSAAQRGHRLAHGNGTWRIVDARTGRVVAGNRRSGYGLTLQQVAERLRKPL